MDENRNEGAEVDQSNQKGKLLVPANRAETRALVIDAVKSAIGEQRQSIGVSVNWLAKHVEQLDLTANDVEALIAVRTEFGGLLPHAVKFLYQGLTPQDVCGCYQARNTLAALNHSASVKKIARLVRTFAEADPDNEDLGDMIAEAHKVISKRYRWVQYVDQSITILCAIQEYHGCATIESALGMIDSRHPREMGVMTEEGQDEVERNRNNYEERRGYGY